MRKIYLKSLLFVWAFVAPFVLLASNVVVVNTSVDFGQRERADITSAIPYQLVNLGTDTAEVLSFLDVAPFSQPSSGMAIAPGDTLMPIINFDRSAAVGTYTAVMEIYLTDDTLSLTVSGSLVDNTPTFTQNDILYWVGTGANQALLVVDFNSGQADESVAFGYKFDGTPTGEDMLLAINNAYADFNANLSGGFLMDITYGTQSGLGGNPEWWMTCSRTDSTLWNMNWGLSTPLTNGSWFGCAYSPVDENWNPTNLPGNPVAAPSLTGLVVNGPVDFGNRERADITSTQAYQLINQGTDTVEIIGFSDVPPFSQIFDTMLVAPGDTISPIVLFDRSDVTGNHIAMLEIYLADDTLSISVNGSIIDNTPTFAQTDIQHWVGSGANSAILVIDFNSGIANESTAFGYRFDGTATGEEMLTAIADVYPDLTTNMAGGFLNDIIYGTQSGLGGNPEWWMTCSRTESTLWNMNWGISTALADGDWFGCTYSPVDSDWNPTNLPGQPLAALAPSSINEFSESMLNIYPNPCQDIINVEADGVASIQIFNIQGQICKRIENFQNRTINISELPSGVYTLKVTTAHGQATQRVVKK